MHRLSVLSTIFTTLLVLALPLTVFLTLQRQDIRQRAQSISTTQFGVQIDIQSPEKIPNSSQISTLNPAWVRFVARPGIPLPLFPSSVKRLVIFNNESAPPAPIGSTNVNEWNTYTDTVYITQLTSFLQNNPSVDAIEVWNEEDQCSGSFCPFVPAQAYAYMIKRASSMIKAQNAAIKVVMGGLASGQSSYVTDVKNADPFSFNQVDAVSIHPYGKSPDGWETGLLPFGDLGAAVDEFATVAAPLPVWITEIGYGTDDTAWQAEYLSRSFKVLAGRGVPVVNWYAWTDAMTGGNGLSNWGLYDNVGSIKPSGNAFASFTKTPACVPPFCAPPPPNCYYQGGTQCSCGILVCITPTPSPTPTPDLTPPTVSITNPLNGSTVSKNTTVTIKAQASDASGIAKVDFFVSTTFMCSDTIAPYECPWFVYNKPKIQYTLKAKAYDKAGNTATHTITVTSK